MHLELDCCVPASTSPRRLESGNGPSSRILVGPLRIFRRFLIELVHRPSVAERLRVVAPVGPIPKTSTPTRIAVFSLFERGKVQCNSFNPDPGPALPSVAQSLVKSPRPSLEARLRPKCQGPVDLFVKYQKVQYHKLTRIQVLDRSGKGF